MDCRVKPGNDDEESLEAWETAAAIVFPAKSASCQ